jgi:hypothetical protein
MCSFINLVMAAVSISEIHKIPQEISEDERFEIGEMYVKIGWHYGLMEQREAKIIGEAPVTAQ